MNPAPFFKNDHLYHSYNTPQGGTHHYYLISTAFWSEFSLLHPYFCYLGNSRSAFFIFLFFLTDEARGFPNGCLPVGPLLFPRVAVSDGPVGEPLPFALSLALSLLPQLSSASIEMKLF